MQTNIIRDKFEDMVSQGIEISQRLEYLTAGRIYGELDEDEMNLIKDLQELKENICKYINFELVENSEFKFNDNILIKHYGYSNSKNIYNWIKENKLIQACSVEFFVEYLLNDEVDKNIFLKPLFEIKTITIAEEVLLLEKFGYEETENFKNIIRHINKMREANEDYDEDGDSISSIMNNLRRSPLYDFIQTQRRLNQIKRLGFCYGY